MALSACSGERPVAPAPSAAEPASAAAKDKITFAFTSPTTDQAPAMIAEDEGFFNENGIDADVVMIGSGSNPSAAVLSGQIQAYSGAAEAILATLNGGDLVFIMTPSSAFQFWLFTVPSITTADQLRGKQIGVTALGASTHTAARLAVRSLGLDPDNDVIYSAVNNPPAIFAAMKNGALQAGAIGSSNIFAARDAGFYEMVDLAKKGIPYPVAWPIVSKKYADAHPDLIQRMVKSLVQAVAFEIQHPAETQQVLGKYGKTDDSAYLKANYELVAPYLQKVPAPSLDGVKNALEEFTSTVPAAKTADPASFVDDHYVKSLEASGFIASLYK